MDGFPCESSTFLGAQAVGALAGIPAGLHDPNSGWPGPTARVDEAELIATGVALPRGAATADTLADDDLESIFGIDLDPAGGVPATARKRPARAARKRKTQPRRSPGAGAASAHPARRRPRRAPPAR